MAKKPSIGEWIVKRLDLTLTLTALILALGFALTATPAFAQAEGTISGLVYEDVNGNGVREAGEAGLLDIEVKFASGGWDTTINTAADGKYAINLNPATWSVTVLPPAGWRATTSTTLDAFIGAPGDKVENLEFGIVRVVTDEEGNEVLPASGGAISERFVILGLLSIMIVGGSFVVVGQRRNKNKVG